jgi:hypothetical protein
MQTMPRQEDVRLTINGVQYTGSGYRILAEALARTLGYPFLKEAENADLRAKVIAKDELFFNRWRPANETYLFGFRKHEQGKNAVEIPMFDPLIDAADKAIHDFVKSVTPAP